MKSLTTLTLLFAFCGTARAETINHVIVSSPALTPIDEPDYYVSYSSVPTPQPYITRQEFDAAISSLSARIEAYESEIRYMQKTFGYEVKQGTHPVYAVRFTNEYLSQRIWDQEKRIKLLEDQLKGFMSIKERKP